MWQQRDQSTQNQLRILRNTYTFTIDGIYWHCCVSSVNIFTVLNVSVKRIEYCCSGSHCMYIPACMRTRVCVLLVHCVGNWALIIALCLCRAFRKVAYTRTETFNKSPSRRCVRTYVCTYVLTYV